VVAASEIGRCGHYGEEISKSKHREALVAANEMWLSVENAQLIFILSGR